MNNFWKSNLVIFIGTALAIIAIVIPFTLNPSTDESINWARARAALSAITIPVLLYGFYYNTVQFRKTMAKPKLKLVFTKTNNDETSIGDLKPEIISQALAISVLNNGNAVTDIFQIDYETRKEIYSLDMGKGSSLTPTLEKGNITIQSFINKHEYICFVNNPTQLASIRLIIHNKGYQNFENPLVIPYKIYGDWGEPQQGKLKVIINKQEAINAQSTG